MATKYTVDDLIVKIQDNINDLNFSMAHAYCRRALEMEPYNVNALELAGQVELELGMALEARQHFIDAIQHEPHQGHSKYMYLGQLSENTEAIAAFQKGIDLMTQERLAATTPEHAKELAHAIVEALCSMTEIYLTDCCFEQDAEKKCEEYLTQAQQVDPNNAEVYQLLASVRLSQSRNDEAIAALQQSMSLWMDQGNDELIPKYESRLALVKMLIEVSLFKEAFTILEGLQNENDEDVDVWYLYGWGYYILGSNETVSPEDRVQLWEDAKECLEMVVNLYPRVDSEELLAIHEHAQELLAEINRVLPATSMTHENVVDEEDQVFMSDEDMDDDDNAMET